MTDPRLDNNRHIKARTGSIIKAKHWTTEAAVRMLMNNLDDEVAAFLLPKMTRVTNNG